MNQLTEEKTMEILQGLGGKLWEKGPYKRVYFNLEEIGKPSGLVLSKDKNFVYSAKIGDKELTTYDTMLLINFFQFSRLFYDFKNGQFCYSKDSLGLAEAFCKFVRGKLEEAATPDVQDVIAQIMKRHS